MIKCPFKILIHMKTLLIVIAIDKYKDHELMNLDYCVSDSIKFKRCFHGYFENSEVKLFTNENANLRLLTDYIKSININYDKIFLFYSGHSINLKDNNYVYVHDSDINDVSTLFNIEVISNHISSFSEHTEFYIDGCDIEGLESVNYKLFAPGHKKTIHESTNLKQSSNLNNLLNIFKKNHQLNLKEIRRNKLIYNDLIDISMSSPKQIINIIGHSGQGKSFTLKSLNNASNFVYYISFPKIDYNELGIIYSIINREILSNDTQFNLYYNGFPERLIQVYCSINPQTILILDHFDRIYEDFKHEVLSFLNELGVNIFVVSNHPYDSIKNKYYYPKISQKDIEYQNHEIIKYIETNSKPNYFKIFEILNKTKEFTSVSKSKKAINAIAISGGIINIDIFCGIFDINKTEISSLLNNGLIFKVNNHYLPHDKLYEYFSTNRINKLIKFAYEYWKHELLIDIDIFSMQNFVLIIENNHYLFQYNDISLYENIFKKLDSFKNHALLKPFSIFLLNNHIPNYLFQDIALKLIDSSDLELIYNFTKLKVLKCPESELINIHSEVLWWSGKFKSCINFANKYLNLDKSKYLDAMCSKAISHFFIGKWEAAEFDFTTILNSIKQVSSRTKFYTYYVLGTLYAIRGIKIDVATNLFIEAIKELKTSNNTLWLGMLLGNIGEILWKAGMYDKASDILSRAEYLTFLCNNKITNLEIKRNLIHISCRTGSDCTEYYNELKECVLDNSENWGKMQIINSIITYNIYHDVPLPDDYFQISKQKTRDNKEYQIYTLANLSMQYFKETDFQKAKSILIKVLDLCKQGQNWLSVKQIYDDYLTLSQKFKISLTHLDPIFLEYQKIVELEVLPNLHHFERLFEYL